MVEGVEDDEGFAPHASGRGEIPGTVVVVGRAVERAGLVVPIAELVCRVGSAPQVIGPLTEPLVEELQPGTTIVGVRFVPGAFPVVAGQPASELVGLALDAEQLWGRSAAALGEAVGTAASPQEARAAVQLRDKDHSRGRKSVPGLIV
jgi:hypothetical protein